VTAGKRRGHRSAGRHFSPEFADRGERAIAHGGRSPRSRRRGETIPNDLSRNDFSVPLLAKYADSVVTLLKIII